MTNEISLILLMFKDCFSRTASFEWFAIVIMGFILRLEHHGVSSIIRWLGLKPSLYTALLFFFRASSWQLKCIQQRWWKIVLSRCPLLTVDNCYLLVGDGIKVPKEAEKMPGVKKLHQESDNSGKAPYIYGHHFGVLGILAGCAKIFCIPLCAELHEGVKQLRNFQNKPEPLVNGKKKVSITSLMASMGVDLIKGLGSKCLLVLDAYFAVGPVFIILKELVDSTGERLAHVVVKGQKNAVGYEKPPPKTGGRGAPRKYGRKLKLMELFKDKRNEFQETTIEIYGKKKTILFLCLNLIWMPIKEKVRFVLVIDGAEFFILMCSDLNLSPSDIIKAYSYRFKIEVNFKVLKHLIGAFSYHFWTRVWPDIAKQNESDLSSLENPRSEELIAQTTNAIEGFVNFGCIATGILQSLSLNFHKTIWNRYRGWLRTITSAIPSEETVRSVIQEEFFYNFHSFNKTAIYRIIKSKSRRSKNIRLPMLTGP
jgi:hypothetical protein